jgi:hypothetical protein
MSERRALLASLLLTVVYAAIGAAVLWRGNPHEDAFILFRYAKNLAAGHGIVYYPGGPHAEGATDFLWMAALAAGKRLGVDPAYGAVALNAAGFFVVANELARVLPARGAARWVMYGFVATLLASPATLAGYLGFSATLYAALALLLLRLYVDGPREWIPPLALLLGLVRPDGVLLGAGFVLLAARDARDRRAYVVRSALALAVGALYFVWRWRYFGELLPLPLVVKSHRPGPLGAWPDFRDWALAFVAPFAFVLAAMRALLGPLGSDLEPGTRRRLWLALVPVGLHVASFAIGVASQNVANRFQAPASLCLFYVAFRLLATRLARGDVPVLRAAAVGLASLAALYPTAVIAQRAAEDAFADNYVNALAREAAHILLRGDRLATTEAGRLPYWSEAATCDLVGLNTAETAHRPPTAELLDAFAPDVVMLHHAGVLDERLLGAPPEQRVVEISAPLADAAGPWAKPLLRTDLPPYRELRIENVPGAALGTVAWLDRVRDRYTIYAVWFESRFAHRHLFAIRNDYPRKRAFLEALRRAQESRGPAYRDLLTQGPEIH